MSKPARVKKSEPVWIVRELKDLPKPSTEGVVWYILYCNVMSEAKAAWGLVDRGFEVYCPLLRRMAKPKTGKPFAKKIEFVRPAFSRYIFVGMTSRSSWWDIRRVEGIESVICNNLAPVKMSRERIEGIMALEDMGMFDADGVAPSQPRGPDQAVTIHVGKEVTLMSGPFEGYSAIVRKAPKKAEGEATIELLGMTVRLPLKMMKSAS